VVTAPSEFLAKLIREYFHMPVVIVPNVLDLKLFRYRERATVQPKLLVTRHLEKIYDVESVVRGFQLVQSRFPAATLWIAGTGSQEEVLRNLVATLNLNHVRFLGQVAHDDLPAIYDQCDICVNASRVDNFPGALLEASAAGMPIVSSRAGGIPFIYENRKNVLLWEPGDWQELATAVEELVLSPSLALQLSTEGMRLAQQFDWDSVRSSLYRAYGMAREQAATRVASTV
jgi:glycosyltransferase involved in cell wall biosynthesis